MAFRLPEINTRFTFPIICPVNGDTISAETLYNRCCDAMGHVVRDHIGDLILDNLRYPEGETPDEQPLCDAVYAWSASVYAQLPVELPGFDEALCDPAKARILFDASKGGNVRGITEDHRFELADVFNAAETTCNEMHSEDPFVTWAFIDDGGERVCIIEYDNLDNAFPFAQELIIRLPACYGGTL